MTTEEACANSKHMPSWWKGVPINLWFLDEGWKRPQRHTVTGIYEVSDGYHCNLDDDLGWVPFVGRVVNGKTYINQDTGERTLLS